MKTVKPYRIVRRNSYDGPTKRTRSRRKTNPSPPTTQRATRLRNPAPPTKPTAIQGSGFQHCVRYNGPVSWTHQRKRVSHSIIVPLSRLPSTTPLKPPAHRALTHKEKHRADEQFLLSEWATRLPLPTPSNPRTSPVTECHLQPINGQRRITDFYDHSQTPVTNTNETRLANNVGPVDQSDSDSDKTVPWDSSCDSPNGYR